MTTKATPSRTRTRGPVVLPEELWSAQRTAGYLGIPVNSLYKLNHTGAISYYKVGRGCRYDPADIRDYLDSAAVLPEGA